MNLYQFIGEPVIEGNICISDDAVEIATEGVSWDIAKMIRADDVKKARALVKEGKHLSKKNHSVTDYQKALANFKEANDLIYSMKEKVDKMPEAVGLGEKIISYFTPIFTLMPSSEITNVMIIPSGNGYYINYTTKTYTDHMSSTTNSHVKESLQEKFNLFLHNLDKTIRATEELIKRSSKSKVAKESTTSTDPTQETNSIATDPTNESSTDDKIEDEIMEGESEDDVAKESLEDPEVTEALEGVFTAVLEGTLTAEQRKSIPDNQFAIPETRSYPLNDEAHIRSAISYFRYVPADKRKFVANNIIKRMKALHIPVEFGSKLVISRYVPREYVVENDERETQNKK